jgi:hypothetical protein
MLRTAAYDHLDLPPGSEGRVVRQIDAERYEVAFTEGETSEPFVVLELHESEFVALGVPGLYDDDDA